MLAGLMGAVTMGFGIAGVGIVATNEAFFAEAGDHEAHDALLCVQTGAQLSDPKRFKFEGTEHYLKTAAEMTTAVDTMPRTSR
mgnify:CR=1 FL=1